MVLNKEIQSQQRLDSLAEAPEPASPRQPRKALVPSESYLQRLSAASRSSLWQEIPVVRNSTVLLSMTHEDQKLQEVPAGRGAGRGRGRKLTSLSSPHHPPHTRACHGCRSSPLPRAGTAPWRSPLACPSTSSGHGPLT